jgi:hypothetical protein
MVGKANNKAHDDDDDDLMDLVTSTNKQTNGLCGIWLLPQTSK